MSELIAFIAGAFLANGGLLVLQIIDLHNLKKLSTTLRKAEQEKNHQYFFPKTP